MALSAAGAVPMACVAVPLATVAVTVKAIVAAATPGLTATLAVLSTPCAVGVSTAPAPRSLVSVCS